MQLKLKRESSEEEAECLQTAAETENTQEFGPTFNQTLDTDPYKHVWACLASVCDVFNLLPPPPSPSSLPGIDFKVKTIDVDGKKVKLQVW